jgi:hypothetical protein
MITPELLQYIKENLAMGKTREQIQQGLVLSGEWRQSDVEEAYRQIDAAQAPSSRHGSFLMTAFLILVILGGVAYGAEKVYGPVINPIVSSMLPFIHFPSPAAPAAIVMPTAMPHPSPAAATIVKAVNGTGFTFFAPADWTDSSSVGDGCPEESIVNGDQTLDAQGNPQGNPGQIDIWPKKCMPPELTYEKQTEKNGFVIATNFDQDTDKQIAATKAAYKLVVDTFKLTP